MRQDAALLCRADHTPSTPTVFFPSVKNLAPRHSLSTTASDRIRSIRHRKKPPSLLSSRRGQEASGARPPFILPAELDSSFLGFPSLSPAAVGFPRLGIEQTALGKVNKGLCFQGFTMSAVPSHHSTFLLQAYENHLKSRPSKGLCFGHSGLGLPSGGARSQFLATFSGKIGCTRLVTARATSGNTEPGDGDNGEEDEGSPPGKPEEANEGLPRDALERLVGKDDASFSGIDLATLIRKKYGRSYDVQLIKKEFLGRNLLAMNVMWKYVEQRSFPLTEEEYLLRLDDVANTLKCWGAVSLVRNTLEKLKERPRIGKAVSIFIDMDESGGRSNEWIYK